MPLRSVVALWPAKTTPLAGEAKVLRALPRVELRRVGPFVFCDHFGPSPAARESMDVPPHPHVGLQTVTYLFSGSVRHTDSLGSDQIIQPGDVNWMTAGRGIVHAEQVLAGDEPLHGVQTWVGLPHAHRKTEPAFAHFPAAQLPRLELGGARVRVVAGRLGEATSPVPTFQPLTYLDVELEPGAETALPVDSTHALAVYVASGQAVVGHTVVDARVLAHLSEGEPQLALRSQAGARLVVLGGTPLAEPTVIWWNFVVDSVAEGRARHADWEAGRFPTLPGQPPR